MSAAKIGATPKISRPILLGDDTNNTMRSDGNAAPSDTGNKKANGEMSPVEIAMERIDYANIKPQLSSRQNIKPVYVSEVQSLKTSRSYKITGVNMALMDMVKKRYGSTETAIVNNAIEYYIEREFTELYKMLR